MSAEIWPDVNYAEPVEKGTKPHWTSVREGTPLRKWADDHGINPYALQHSIAKKGTKPTRFVRKTFDSAKRRVEDDIVRGFSRFVTAVDEGKI